MRLLVVVFHFFLILGRLKLNSRGRVLEHLKLNSRGRVLEHLKLNSHGRVLEHLEYSGTDVFMDGPIVHKLCVFAGLQGL